MFARLAASLLRTVSGALPVALPVIGAGGCRVRLRTFPAAVPAGFGRTRLGHTASPLGLERINIRQGVPVGMPNYLLVRYVIGLIWRGFVADKAMCGLRSFARP